MYGGDEVSAIVVDVGSDTTKAGYAGEDSPKMVFPSALGVLSSDDGAKKYSVDEMNFPTPGLEVCSAFTDGLISNWEGYEQARGDTCALSLSLSLHALTHATHARTCQQIWTHTLKNRLRIESVEHPLMVAEPTHNKREQREKMVQLLFEKFQPPALFLAKNSVLSSFAVGRPTSLVIDCGASGTLDVV